MFYECECCNFITERAHNLIKHKSTFQHIKKTKNYDGSGSYVKLIKQPIVTNNIMCEEPPDILNIPTKTDNKRIYLCDCGKECNSRQNLSYHKTKCNYKSIADEILELDQNNQYSDAIKTKLLQLKNKEKELTKKESDLKRGKIRNNLINAEINFTPQTISKTREKTVDKSDGGYLYCIHNIMFERYDKNCYKVGKSNNADNRVLDFMTGYVEPSKIKLQTKYLRNRHLAETIMFKLLEKYRVVTNREFVICDLKHIKVVIMHIESLFEVYSDDNDIRNIYNINMKCEACGYKAPSDSAFYSHIKTCKLCNDLDKPTKIPIK